MPGLDGTGPRGEGPMTGGGRGYCTPGQVGNRPTYGWGYGYGRGYGQGRGIRRGYGRGRGFGWREDYPGWGGWYGGPYTMSPGDEVNMLKAEADAISSDLEVINRRIEELEKDSSE